MSSATSATVFPAQKAAGSAARPEGSSGTVLPVRRRLLEAAGDLFYAQGMAATGIGAVLGRAGVARRSLYQHFGSKEALIDAWIQERHDEWLSLYRARESALPEGEGRWRRGVLAVFEAYADHAVSGRGGGFRGCGLINAAAELPNGTEGRMAVREHKEKVERILQGWLEQALPEGRSRCLAHHLSYLLEGAMVRAGLENDVARIREARTLADAVLEGAA